MSEVYSAFIQPAAAFRGKPFWSWNGRLEREELLRQVHVMKEMGFGGFFMHSRTGLVTEYLGEEWFAHIAACAAEAEALGMEAWLYDEDRWPSGTAGGLVTSNPRFRSRNIHLRIVKPHEFVWTDDLIAVFTCKLNGLTYDHCHRLARGDVPTLDSKYSVLSFSVEEMETESFYNGATYVDTLNREATDEFIRLTHERYLQFCGDQFGSAIKGIFTDEPHRGSVMDGFGIRNEEGGWRAPWTFVLFDEFQGRFGYDLVERLPDLFLQLRGERVSQVKWHYIELLQQLFLENYLRPLHDWCHQHGLVLTGHGLHEDSLTAQTAMTGSLMRLYEHMGQPGIDILSEGNRCYWVAKQLSSVGRQLGRTWLLSELYGCTGWQLSFAGHKAVGDWQALFGVNVRCHHLSWYTMEGEAKRDYPASILHQSAWWKDYGAVETYFARLGFFLSIGAPVCDVLVLNPVESVWCQVSPQWSRGLSPQTEAVQKLETAYSDVFHWLAGAQIDFDYGDEEMLSRLGSVQSGEGRETLLGLGLARYRVVVVAGMTTIRSSTLQRLSEFARAGGRVVFAGQAPAYVDALLSEAVMELAAPAARVAWTQKAVVDACRVPGYIHVKALHPTTNQSVTDIFCQVRVNEDSYYLVFLNSDRERDYMGIRLLLPGKGIVEEWNCLTGGRVRVPFVETAEGLLVVTDFSPAGERVFVVTPNLDEDAPLLAACEEVAVESLRGPFAYELSEPNICVLDLASYQWNGEEWQDETEVLKIDRAVRKSAGLQVRSGDMIQPWFAQESERVIKGHLVLAYTFVVEQLCTDLELVMERPEHFVVHVNELLLDRRGFERNWIDACFHKHCIAMSSLVVGTNVIRVECDFHEGINLEAMYLIGSFGVRVQGAQKTLTALPQQLEVGDICVQGLPFYSGIVTYIASPARSADSTSAKADNWRLRLPSYAGAYAKVTSADAANPRMLAWPPSEADITDEVCRASGLRLDIALTRRNTFGPLHLYPTDSPFYGPDHWLTTGEQFRQDYVLLPSGLLEPPQLVSGRRLPTMVGSNWR